MLGFNPYVALGGTLALIAAVSGAFFEGKHVANGEHATEQLGQLTKALNDRDAKQLAINGLETKNAQLEQQRQTVTREITHEVQTIITRPVYATRCVDDAGVQLLDRAQANSSGAGSIDPLAPSGAPAEPAKGPAQH